MDASTQQNLKFEWNCTVPTAFATDDTALGLGLVPPRQRENLAAHAPCGLIGGEIVFIIPDQVVGLLQLGYDIPRPYQVGKWT